MMNISLNNRPNRVCCRLCLAPENECVNIYMTSAADKEPLSLKINACVRIKVSQSYNILCGKEKKRNTRLKQIFRTREIDRYCVCRYIQQQQQKL